MKTKNTKYELPEDAENIFTPDDLMSVLIERNGCIYKWGIPYKNFKAIQDMEEPFKENELIALGGKILNVLVTNGYAIDFKQKTGVRKLDVAVFSSESEDRQLLHNLTSKFRKKDKQVDKDKLPGTNNNGHE
jgi:hypothetical protein